MADHEEESCCAARVGLRAAQQREADAPLLPAGMNRERREKGGGSLSPSRRSRWARENTILPMTPVPFLGEPFADDATRRAQGVEESCDVLGREGCIDDPSRDG